MSLKFDENRSVDYRYLYIPLKYTGIKHPKHKNKELVIIDDLGKHYTAAWRNMKTNKVGITFLLKKINKGFIYKDKEIKHNKSGWVF